MLHHISFFHHSNTRVTYLLPMLINREPLESQVPSRPIMRLHGSGQVNRALHTQILHPILHHLKVHSHHAGHLDRATEGDLAIALRKVQVANGELCTSDVYGKEDFAAPTEVLDVAVAAVFGTSWVVLVRYLRISVRRMTYLEWCGRPRGRLSL